MPTTTYTPTVSVTYLLNGVDVTTLPVDLVETKTGTITTSDGAVTNNVAVYKAQNTPAAAIGTQEEGLGAQLLENFAGTYGYYSGFSVVPATAGVGLSAKQGEITAWIEQGPGAFPPLPATGWDLGSHVLDVTPYAAAMVTQVASVDPTTGFQRFDGIPGVKVTVTVQRSGGAPDYVLLGGAVTGSAQRFLIDSAPTSFHFQMPEYSTLDAQSASALPITGPNPPIPWSPVASTTPGVVERKGCPTPFTPYDPYFGRAATGPKDVTGLTLRLEFPSGVVWQRTVSSATLFGVFPTTGYQLGTHFEGNGVLHIPAGGGGISVSLTSSHNNGINTPPLSKYRNAGGTDLDLGAAAAQAAYADPSAVSYGGNVGLGNFDETTATGPPRRDRFSFVAPIPGPAFVFVLDASFDYTTPPAGVAALGMHEDGHRRTVAVSPGTSLSYQTTKDGGHTFDGYSAGGSGPKNASVWVDPRTNTPRILWDDGTTLSVTKATKDGEQGDWV